MFRIDEVPTSRRDFLVRSLQVALTGVTLEALLPLHALARGRERRQERGQRGTLVVIYLRGGCDALNMVVPYRDRFYYEHRPTIGIAPKDRGQEPGVVELGRMFGLHPGLAAFYKLWEKKQFAPIINVGSPHPSRSHFDCQDFMEYAAPGDRTVKQGWLNRFLQLSAEGKKPAPGQFRSVAAQALLPRSLRGPYPVLAVPPLRGGRGGEDPLDIFDEIYGEDGATGPMAEMEPRDEGTDPNAPVVLAGRNTIEELRRYRKIVSQPAADEGRAQYPAHPLAEKLRQIARLIKAEAGLEVAAIDYPGWDHHAREGGVGGKMHEMLEGLAGSVVAFLEDLGEERARSVTVLTMSEFGRTVRENGNEGTDHGHGGIMLAAGGPVRGGKVYGRYTPLDPKALYQERDLPVYTDFRAVFDETLRAMFAFEPPRDFFPGYRVRRRERPGFLEPLG